MRDRFGLGWRPALAAGIFACQDQIDVVEVIAEDYFEASPEKVRSLRTLAEAIPLSLHGTSMGMASSAAVEPKRLEAMARLVDAVRPEFWSEHLSFVRGGGLEIGHLAAPPRTTATIAGAAENLRRARTAVGALPCVENIATLIEPPGSEFSEADWVSEILSAGECGLLLDLHNVYANGLNHGYSPQEFLRQIPMERVRVIHLAGGKWIPAPDGGERLLDDHLHEVPQPVYDLLEEAARLCPNPLTVIVERDGDFPSMKALCGELDQAREAVRRGRDARGGETLREKR